MAIPGFPNMFTMLGHNVAPTHGTPFLRFAASELTSATASVLFQLETQANYVTQCISAIANNKAKVLEVKVDAAKKYME
jgi:hypothetical protein